MTTLKIKGLIQSGHHGDEGEAKLLKNEVAHIYTQSDVHSVVPVGKKMKKTARERSSNLVYSLNTKSSPI